MQFFLGPLTHEIKNVVKVSFHLTVRGDENGIDALDADGHMTILRFEQDRK